MVNSSNLKQVFPWGYNADGIHTTPIRVNDDGLRLTISGANASLTIIYE